MPETKSYLDGYITVPERIAKFYELYAQGRLVTTDVRLSNEPDGIPRVLVEAAAYRTPDDPLPGRGWSWMILPGTTNFTRGSELENTETSAWGRAIAALGILTDSGVATAQEVQNKEGEDERPAPQVDTETLDLLGRVDVRGKAIPGGSDRYKGDWRDTPDGPAIGFKLARNGDKDIPQVLITGPIGEALRLGDAEASFMGTQVHVKGRLYAVKVPGRTTYNRLVVGEAEGHFIETADLRIPPLRDSEDEVLAAIPVAEGQVPAFDLEESARIDAEAAAAS